MKCNGVYYSNRDKPVNTSIHITSLEEANQYLVRFHTEASTRYTLDNMLALMQYLGNPQDKLKVVHVAGTSGKTSTSYYVAALLTAAGCKTGLTVSPHVDAINERVQINGAPLPEKEFCRALAEFLNLIEAAPVTPSWFELMVAFAYWYFEQVKVDYAVIEVGLGGLKDGTNVIKREDKVCIITDIGLDHRQVLGNTLSEIALQKAGIIGEKNDVFMHAQPESVMRVIEREAARHSAALHVIQDKKALFYENMPLYQQRNWALAYEAYSYVANRDGLQHLTRQVLQETQHTIVPGRLDTINVHGKTVVLDGAHNEQKMTAFIESFQKLYPDVKPAVLIGLKESKDYKELVPLLSAFASRIITTEYTASQDLPIVSMPADRLANAFKGRAEVKSEPDKSRALERLFGGDEEVLVVTGSFYLLGQIRQLLT
jgi:dihydrofolate synthase/folylpolyglutamate synthase